MALAAAGAAAGVEASALAGFSGAACAFTDVLTVRPKNNRAGTNIVATTPRRAMTAFQEE
jgi:hypothetical protein